MTKLFIVIGIVLILIAVYRVGVFFWKVGDDIDIDATKKEMKHNAELVDDVTEYTEKNQDIIDKASKIDIVKKFVDQEIL